MAGRKLVVAAVLLVLGVGCRRTAAEDRVLFEKESAYNTVVVTEDGQGLRTLWFDKSRTRQSVVKVGDPDHLELNYTRVMPVGLAFVEDPKRVLVVGLGGGTIPGFLHKHFPNMQIDVVDIDPVVVEAAKEFFGFREDDSMRAYVEDGRPFIARSPGRYDVIFLDAFGSDNIPYALATREFLQLVRRALTPGGVAVANVWSRPSNPLYDSMVRTYQDTFEELYVFDVRGAGNKILIALPRKGPVDPVALTRRAREISRENEFPMDMGDAVTYGFRLPGGDGARGEVLRDEDKQRKAG